MANTYEVVSPTTLWIYYGPTSYMAWVYLAEQIDHPFHCVLIGTWEIQRQIDKHDLRVWISRRIKLLGYSPPFLNIDHQNLFGPTFT